MTHRDAELPGRWDAKANPISDAAAHAGHRTATGEPNLFAQDGPLATLEHALQGRQTSLEHHRYLLLFRFLLVNLVGFALLGAAYMQGWIDKVVAGDATGIVLLIAGLFLVGLGISGWKIWRTSNDLNAIKGFDPLRPSRVSRYLTAVRARRGDSRAISAESLKLKMSSRIAVVRHIADTLVLLGLIGTVIGFIIALSGVDPSLTTDVKAVGPMVSTLIEGMSVALYTTLVGAVFNIWLLVNYRLLLSGTVNLITAVVELGERYARD